MKLKRIEETYYYDTEEEFKKHREEIKADKYDLRDYATLNIGGSEADKFVIAAVYRKDTNDEPTYV